MKHTLLFTAIASVLVANAYADTIVTSKTYVDNRDALKVDIAQGTGDNNANVGKTLVVNSSGNLELGTPAATNYVEDSITDGVTTKAPSENAVHDALADKQDTIGADMMEYRDGDMSPISFPTVVSYDSTNGVSGTQYGILDDVYSHPELIDENTADLVWPEDATKWLTSIEAAGWIASDAVRYGMVEYFPASGQTQTGLNGSETGSGLGTAYWLDNRVKGVSLVTRTTNDGLTGERQIFEASDVANYNSGTASEQQVKSISIPTMGAVMAAISANTPTLPTGTANTVVMYNNSGAIGGSRAIYNGSTTYNAQNDSDKIATAGFVETKQDKQIGAAPVGNANSNDAGKVLVVDNDGKIAIGTTSATGSYQPYTATANQISGANGTWKSLGTTLDTTDTTNYDADNAVKASVIVTAMNTKQTKKTCAGWPDNIAVADRTDSNCWLWNMPD